MSTHRRRRWFALALGALVGIASSSASAGGLQRPVVIVATAGRTCQIEGVVLYEGVPYLSLSEMARCLDGESLLSEHDGVVEVTWLGRRLQLWPWATTTAILNGATLLPLPAAPWAWYRGDLMLRRETLELLVGSGVALQLRTPERLPWRYGVPLVLRVDPPRERQGLRILIDPGHGGRDQGAVAPSNGLEEKVVTLAIAHELVRILTRRGYQVRLTREEDSYPTLRERVEQANRWGADLFVSIHCNSAPRRTAAGLETYILSRTASDPRALALARFENAYDQSQVATDEVEALLGDLARQAHDDASRRLAPRFHEAVVRHLQTPNRGVRQAPFFVLEGTTMPAFLVEVGFLSNPDEAALLALPSYRLRLAEAIAAGVEEIRPFLEISSGRSVTAATSGISLRFDLEPHPTEPAGTPVAHREATW